MSIRCFYSALTIATVLLTAVSSADEIEDLKSRVAELEVRVETLERSLAAVQPLLEKARLEQLRASQQVLARKRMQQDRANYTQEELQEIEALYQVANRKWRSPEAQESLQKLVEKYDKANRTGCAILYLGQMNSGEKKITLLTKAIEQHGDCFYGNGVQVGAYARFLLALEYLEADKKTQAEALFAELKSSFPEAVDHRGDSLVTLLPQ